jgi:surface polysaccharide O-acyltransferase-like enzyme
MHVCLLWMLCGRGLCDELITRPKEFYRLRCVVVCYLEISWLRKPCPTEGLCAKRRKKRKTVYFDIKMHEMGNLKYILLIWWLPLPVCRTTMGRLQDSETDVMHFLFNLLRIKGLYLFRALLAHTQETLHKRNLVYCVRVMSVGCTRIEVDQFHSNPGAAKNMTRRQYTKFRLCGASWGWASNSRNM